MRKFLLLTCVGLCTVGLIAAVFILHGQRHFRWLSSFSLSGQKLLSRAPAKKPLPFLQYSIPNLATRQYQPSDLTVGKLIQAFPKYREYEFSYTTFGKKMTGQLNVPNDSLNNSKVGASVIVLVRGFVPLNIYKIGVGTKSAAEVFAEHGYVTFAPDFFGYGDSDPETTDTWEARFQKPVEVADLITSIQKNPNLTLIENDETSAMLKINVDSNRLGIWAHSNGGQIALTTLEALHQPIPTTLWAPVTAPFPYSILYFTDEDPDEGLRSRQIIADFEKDYSAYDFSLTDHLDLLRGPLQIHQGTADESIHFTWSQKFVDKIEKENLRRKTAATVSAEATDPTLQPIAIRLFTHPGADHNMKPTWNEAIKSDLEFFQKNLQ